MIRKLFLATLPIILGLVILVPGGIKYGLPLISFAQGSIQPVAYVPISITNNQDIGTPDPFQVMVDVHSTDYAAYEAADLSNVAFAYPNGSLIPSWLESGNSNSSADTLYWLKIGSIPAMSNVTVNMDFYNVTNNVLNNVTTGEAPQLSSRYGQYDDGPNVFVLYGDFGMSMNGWQVSHFQGNFIPNSTAKGIMMLDGGNNEATYLISPDNLPQIPIDVEESWSYSFQHAFAFNPHGANGISMFGASPFGSSTSVMASESIEPVLNQSISAIFDYHEAYTHLWQFITDSQVGGGSFTGSGNFDVISHLSVNETWAWTGYANPPDASLEAYGTDNIPTVASGSIPNPFSNSALIIGAANGDFSSIQYLRWVIARALPPNGVAPSTAIDNVHLVPEFQSAVFLSAFIAVTSLAAIALRRKHLLHRRHALTRIRARVLYLHEPVSAPN